MPLDGADSCFRSGVFPNQIQAENHEAEQDLIRDAKLGLANIQVKSMRKLRAVRALSLRNVKTANHAEEVGDHSKSATRIWSLRRQQWSDRVFQAWKLCGFLDALFVFCIVPYRVGFLFDPWNSAESVNEWTTELIGLTIMDLLGCVVRSLLLRRQLKLAFRRLAAAFILVVVRITCGKWALLVRLLASLNVGSISRSRSSLRLSASRSQQLGHPAAITLIHREGTLLRRNRSFVSGGHGRESFARTGSGRLRSSRLDSDRRSLPSIWSAILVVSSCFPWEVLVIGENLNYLHIAGLLRFPQARTNVKAQFTATVVPALSRWRIVQVLSFSTVSVTAYLFVIGIYLCHIAACGYMLIAHIECGISFAHCSKFPTPEAWVLRDNLESGSSFRKYIRTLYWGCKTVVTLGQGDLIPVTLLETAYRVCIQFASGLWATAIVTGYSFYFTLKDTNMSTNISTQLIQVKRFLRAREITPELSNSVSAYFYYMERTRNGVEEAIIVSNMPPHYRSQCSNYVKFKCFGQIPIFRNRQGAFLRTILSLLENDFFTPNQTVVQVGEKEEMLIVASGTIRIIDVKNGGLLVGRLATGTSYAEYTLFENHIALNLLISDTFVELWRLSKRSFDVAVHKHFGGATIASNYGSQAEHQRSRASSVSDVTRNLNSLHSMQTSARLVKLAGKGSTLMKAFARKGSNATIHKRDVPLIITRRHPQSRFRRYWLGAECALLSFLLWEVPYQVAFQRGFGLLNDHGVHPNTAAIPIAFQQLNFFVSVLVELFFLIDLILRSLYFLASSQDAGVDLGSVHSAINARSPIATNTTTMTTEVTAPTAPATPATTPVTTGQASFKRLFHEKRAAFKRFLGTEPDYRFDLIALLPISLVWDILPKEHFSGRVVQIMRFTRLIRLLRVRQMRKRLKLVMVDLGFTPAQRLLVYIILLCVTVGNLAGCLFFLVADAYDFHGGLPVEGVLFMSISWQECLESASLADNCTWYMYDRSTFNIDAPYLRSLHWSIVLLSTVGYGDIVSFSTIECVIGCIWIFLGANICYFTSSALSSVLDQLSIVSLLKDERVEELNVALLGMPTVSDATKRAIRSYYEMKWKLNGSTLSSEDLALRLPRTLRRDLWFLLYLEDYSRCPLFAGNNASDEFIRELALVTTSEIFLKHIVVAREGHLATEFFLIQSGECECLLPAVRMAPRGGVRRGSSDRKTLLLSGHISPIALRAQLKKRHNNKVSVLLEPAPPLLPTPVVAARRNSGLRKLSRSTFSAPASALPDHVQLLQLQHKKSAMFKSAANLSSASDDLQDPNVKRSPSPRWLQMIPQFGEGNRKALSSPQKQVLADAIKATSVKPIVKPLSHPPVASPILRTMPNIRRRDTLRSVVPTSITSAPLVPIPVLMLKQSDYFGEESLLDAAELYDVTVRVVSSAVQVAVVRRCDFIAVAARFPKRVAIVKARNQTQRVLDRQLLQTHRSNFVTKAKVGRFFFGRRGDTDSSSNLLGESTSDDFYSAMSVESNAPLRTGASFVLDPEARFAMWWRRVMRVIFVYNFVAISFRVAFLWYPKSRTWIVLTTVDYAFDLLLYVDLFLKYGHMGYVELGEKTMDPVAIRRHYRETWLWADCVSMLPLYFITGSYLRMTLTRIPRLVRSVHLAGITSDMHTYIQENYLQGNTLFSSLFDLVKFFLIFLSTAHYASCIYYLLGRLQIETGLVERSWISTDPILLQHPRSPTVHYMRAFYWCLSTFTVDCFGDIWARNFLETLFAMFTCALGWIFIGQVIGRINALMITLDKDRKQRDDRIEHFQQYAKQRRLPESLRLRGLEGLHYKSECSVSLRLGEILKDLPPALRTGLFYELYGPMLHSVPELNTALAPVHLEALSSALYLEIYLHGDIIYEAGRMGNRLYLLQNGIVEVYSAISGVQFGLLEAGTCKTVSTNECSRNICSMFGEFAFFLRGARRLTSTRAVRSCQVLQLDRSAWNRLWPRSVRRQIEYSLLPHIQKNYRSTARAYLNIEKNLFVRSDAPMPSITVCGREVAAVIAEMQAAPRSWVRPKRLRGRTIISVAPQEIKGEKIQRRRSSGMSPAHERARVEAAMSVYEQTNYTTTVGAHPTIAELRRKSSRGLIRANSLDTPVESFGTAPVAEVAVPVSLHAAATTPPKPENTPTLPRMESLRRLVFTQFSGSGRRLTVTTPPGSEVGSRASKITVTKVRRSLVTSTVIIELQWKHHEKRLRALQLFAYGWAQVEQNVQLRNRHILQRRKSFNTVQDLRENVHASKAACSLGKDALSSARMGPRRHSLQIVRADLDKKFALNDVAIPTLAARITAYLTAATRMHGLARRRSTVDSGSNSGKWSVSRRMSSVNMDEDPYEYEENYGTIGDSVVGSMASQIGRRLFAFLAWPFRRLLCRGNTQVSPLSSKVAPIPAGDLQTQTASGDSQKSNSIAPVKSNRFAINSRFRRVWSSVMLAVTAYSITISPYRVSFMDGFLNEREIELWVALWFALELLLVDGLCAVDFVFHRCFFAYVDGGETITDPQTIATHYWQHGSYLLDIASFIPIELLLVAAIPLLGPPPIPQSPNEWPLFHSPSGGFINWHTIAFLKLNRFLRVAHFHSLSDEIQLALLYESKSLAKLQLRPGILYLVRLGFDFLLGTHWLACIFFGVSYLHYQDGDISWLTAPGMLTFEGSKDLGEIRRVPVAEAYLRSFHFSIGAITTVCYGDILPMNAVENAATLAVIFVSVVLFSMLSGGFFKFFAMELGTRAEFEERVSQVGHFMAFHDFPSDMWTQMKVYFALSWQESKGKYEEQQLSGLPTILRQDIARLVHANLIQNVRLFQTCEESFSKAIIAAIKHEFFVRNDVIIQRGDMERSLYIVETGLVVISAVRKKKPGTRVASMASVVDGGASENHRASMTMTQDSNSHYMDQATTAASVNDDHEDSVNEWLALASEEPSKPTVSPQATVDITENAVVGIVSPTDPPDINTATERAERIVKGPFDFFGERSLLFGTPRNATCVAACVSSLFVLTSDRFEAILEEFPAYRSKVVRAWVMTRYQPAEESTKTSSKSKMKPTKP